ncbi:uncharacterized protein LOC135137877 [Zophobas morio]|uniref:uncharacterized protein LOC135137877 n=1 Tax=Zophobas morio TaxID=2755281 RepID=UPI00308327B4
MTINFYSDLKRVQHVTFRYVLRKIIKRYIRFTSGQIILIALHSTWFIRLSRGPFWEQVMGPDHRQCNEKWWINLLYISNFFFDDGACSLHTWYLSVDFQLTLLGLLILWLTQKNPRRLFLASKTLLFLQIVWTFLYLRWNDFEFSAAFTPELLYDFKFTFSKEWQATWISTMSNLAGLAWGLIFGYLYSHLQNNAFSTKRVNVWWYAIVIICTFGTIFFSGFYKTSDYYSNSRWFAASYGSIEKVVCVFGISFFIFGTLQGLGGFIRNVLEWAPMHTLGKLSFGAYLIHFVFFSIDNALKRYPTYVSPYLMIVWTFLYLRWNDFEFSAALTPELLYDFKFTFSKEWQATWISTMSNLAGLAWGLIFGYLYSHRQNNTFSTKRVNIWWYAIVIISTFGTIFFSGFYKTSDYYSNSRWFAASYGSIEKVVCVFGISFFIFGTLQGLGGFIRSVLEWAPMHTLGKLSFGGYLIHFVFFSIDNALKRSPTYVSPCLMQKDILINELREQIRALRESDGAKKGDNNIDNQGAPALEKRDIKHQSLHKNVKKNKQNDSAKTSKSISLNVNNNTDMNSVNESTKPDERGQNDTSVVPKQDEWQTSKHRNSRKRQRVIVGESEENANGVATLQTVPKFIDLHVYRLHPSTTEADVIGYLKPMFKEVLCETLPSKHPLQYSSFKWKKKNQPTQK